MPIRAALRATKSATTSLAVLVLMTQYQNCGGVSFSQIPQNESNGPNTGLGGGATPTCTEVLQTTAKNIRILFMVDESTSTLTTDPNLYYRDQTIKNFLSAYGMKTNFTYAFGYFAADSASIYDQIQDKFIVYNSKGAPPKGSPSPYIGD